MDVFLHPAVVNGAVYLAPVSAPAATIPTPDPAAGTIDAMKVPLSRQVLFEGSKRVVSFEGSIRKVRF